jgi:hypothetical protein
MHLGYGEKDQTIAQMTAAYAGLAQDASLAGMFGQPQRYEMIRDIMKLRGWPGASRYIAPPSQQTQPQPDPLRVQELQIKDKSANANIMDAQNKAQQLQTHSMVEGLKLHQQQQKIIAGALETDRDMSRKDADVANRINIAQREMALAEKTPPGKREAIVSA